jgi:hypothetical protein
MPERFLLDSSAFIAFHPEFATVPAPLKQEMLPPKIPLPAATWANPETQTRKVLRETVKRGPAALNLSQ